MEITGDPCRVFDQKKKIIMNLMETMTPLVLNDRVNHN